MRRPARRLYPNYVRRLEALGTFEQIEFHRLPFIQRAIAILLNGGKMDKNIFASGALNKTVPFRSIEPFNCAFLSHKKLLSPLRKN